MGMNGDQIKRGVKDTLTGLFNLKAGFKIGKGFGISQTIITGLTGLNAFQVAGAVATVGPLGALSLSGLFLGAGLFFAHRTGQRINYTSNDRFQGGWRPQ